MYFGVSYGLNQDSWLFASALSKANLTRGPFSPPLGASSSILLALGSRAKVSSNFGSYMQHATVLLFHSALRTLM